MFKISILINIIGVISGSYLEAESNYRKPKLERNNIVNKGLWVRNVEKRPTGGAFIFRANSLDVDTLLQGNNDVFSENSPFISSYVERNKRSAYRKQRQPFRESMKKCSGATECTTDDVLIQSNLINKLKPAFFNDFPYDFAIVISDVPPNADINNMSKRKTEEQAPLINQSNTSTVGANIEVNKTINQKRSMSNFYDFQDVKKVEITETLNDTDDGDSKIDRSVFDKEKDIVWHQTAPVNVYQVLPKNKEIKDRPISERGIMKVLSMLTKTFKKIMKQHNEIKNIHRRLESLNGEVEKKIDDFNKKFVGIDSKYDEILKVNLELIKLEEKLKSEEQHFNDRDRGFSKNLLDFENQQRKFLAQQKQFYGVQKIMLEANEKINLKQNIITKTQSEISQKQNNFWRLLKKMQLTNANTKPHGMLNIGITKPIFKKQNKTSIVTTTQKAVATESVKINLLSIPEKTPLQNHDKLILDDKDKQNIDDLIYKYYFNNTFIDNVMKSKILASFAAEKRAIKKKNKRNNIIDKKTTILLPVDSISGKDLINKHAQRDKRWIRYLKSNNGRKNIMMPTTKAPIQTTIDVQGSKLNKLNPFIIMATSFCNEIGQNGSTQILSWCIEKALRRLQIMNLKFEEQLNPATEVNKGVTQVDKVHIFTTTKEKSTQSNTVAPVEQTTQQTQSSLATKSSIVMYFPDNEELESNLKQYELVQDNEGTVYFDGSLHSSDIARISNPDIDSEGFSDIMPGLDSNSKVELDPRALDLQALRRANVRRINERIINMKMV
ncbi:uncharacterized protein LOC123717393 [Pieris brassicae]|uniref:uncharacterized protein LOC123717393 n=1 Tax=Pieris brassicae TaxID=7116 RepID=UPI001E65E637|nr:uncharacterized protein LOC123717393 [Pieris brassicae]